MLNPECDKTGKIETEFVISDTTGVISTVFKSGENFDMKFVLTNNTGKDQEFYHSGPIIIFDISQDDSVLTSCIHGLCWTAEVLKGIFKKDTEITSKWQAPNSPLDSQLDTQTILKPGEYNARVRISMDFIEYEAIPSEVKTITITE